MKLPAFKFQEHRDPAIGALQRAVRDALHPLLDADDADARHVADTYTAAPGSDAVIDHGLGRTPLGWSLTDLDAAATLHRVAWDERTLTLRASAACSFRLKVW